MKIAKKKKKCFYLEDLLYLKLFAEKKMRNEIKGIKGRSGIKILKNINTPT